MRPKIISTITKTIEIGAIPLYILWGNTLSIWPVRLHIKFTGYLKYAGNDIHSRLVNNKISIVS